MVLSKRNAINWSINELCRIKDELDLSGSSLGDIGFMQFFTDKPPVSEEDKAVLDTIYEACEHLEKAVASVDKTISSLKKLVE